MNPNRSHSVTTVLTLTNLLESSILSSVIFFNVEDYDDSYNEKNETFSMEGGEEVS